ncbi:ABC transporter permease [Solirubrobacter phytolaccae]|uniref:ABC transporter permease n=1 Tax=Solirubrobacter phytolaccae TaxID=1404360 RepID=A0A9X3NBJ2_9ACTN|nr:ABC transporter permease subunit [Solirubrobacter phytolaccae]MDA0182079.1 ABC transporter permease [Solirubrobacter phytolaccae]
MIWLTWRQFRFPAAVVGAAAALLALLLLVVGAPAAGQQAVELLMADKTRVNAYTFVTIAMLLLPAVIGMFWGAPLVARELEAGTHRLVWNQSVTRTRWLLTKVLLIGGAAMAATVALGLVLTWWTHVIDDALIAGADGQGIAGQPRMSPVLYASRGIVPAGYAAFAFTLGVLLGTVLRRTVPAMAITAAVFAAVQLTVPPLIRAHLSPVTETMTVTGENLGGFLLDGPPEAGGVVKEVRVQSAQPGAWMIANETVDKDGNAVGEYPSWLASCVQPDPERMAPLADPACFKRFADLGYRQRVVYQPAGRYWTLQAVETIGFVLVSGALLGLTFFWVRRRVA